MGNVVSGTGATTSDIAEGSNHYWTQTRFDNAFGLKSTNNLTEGGTNLYFTSARSQAQTYLALSGSTISNYLTGNLTASRALASDGSGKVGVATTTLTELNFVNGVTSPIQTQFTTLTTNLATTNSNVATATGQIATLNTNVATITGQIVTINANIATTNSNVATATGNIATLSGRVNTLSGVVDLKANIASPVLTGDPQSVTPATSDSDTSIATTAFVKAQTYLTGETDPIWNSQKSLYALLASPALTGTPTAPTATPGTSTFQLATTQFVTTADTLLQNNINTTNANVATATGQIATLNTNVATITGQIVTINANIATTNSNVATATGNIATLTTNLATTNSNVATATGNIAFLSGSKADINSPILTGDPRVPTATPGDNDTSIASTAFVKVGIDTAIAGLSWKNSARVATTANITLSGLQTIDGYTTIAGDRVLVKNQSTATQNGMYIAAV